MKKAGAINTVNVRMTADRKRHARRAAVTAIALLAAMPVIMPIMPVLANGAATNGGAMYDKILPVILMFIRVLGIGSFFGGGVLLIWSFMDNNPGSQKPALVMILAGAFLFGLQIALKAANLGTLIDV